MGFIRAAIWTAICVGLGVFVSTYELNGKTPLEHIQKEWKSSSARSQLEGQIEGQLDGKLDQLVDGAKTKIAPPVEKISKADRDSLNSLIAKKAK